MIIVPTKWWKDFLRDSGGTGFWHETYARNGDMAAPTGMMRFATLQPARGGLFSARRRLGVHGKAKLDSAVTEDELVGKELG